MRIQWRSTFSLGHRGIDEDHKQLLNLLNEFEASPNLATAKTTANRLMSYCVDHFAREEKVFEAAQYPDLRAHKESHRLLSTRLRALLLDGLVPGADGKPAAQRDHIQAVGLLLREWVMQHVLVEDLAARPYIERLAERLRPISKDELKMELKGQPSNGRRL